MKNPSEMNLIQSAYETTYASMVVAEQPKLHVGATHGYTLVQLDDAQYAIGFDVAYDNLPYAALAIMRKHAQSPSQYIRTTIAKNPTWTFCTRATCTFHEFGANPTRYNAGIFLFKEKSRALNGDEYVTNYLTTLIFEANEGRDSVYPKQYLLQITKEPTQHDIFGDLFSTTTRMNSGFYLKPIKQVIDGVETPLILVRKSASHIATVNPNEAVTYFEFNQSRIDRVVSTRGDLETVLKNAYPVMPSLMWTTPEIR